MWLEAKPINGFWTFELLLCINTNLLRVSVVYGYSPLKTLLNQTPGCIDGLDFSKKNVIPCSIWKVLLKVKTYPRKRIQFRVAKGRETYPAIIGLELRYIQHKSLLQFKLTL